MTETISRQNRRGHREGSIWYREDRKTWTAQVTVQVKRVSRAFQSRSEAQKWVREMQSSVETGMTDNIARSSLLYALQQWLVEGKRRWEPATYELYDHLIHKHITPHIKKSLKVMDVKPFHIQELINKLRIGGVGVRTQKYVRSTLFTFFEDLHFQRVFQYNPAEGVIVEYKPPEMKTLSAEQVHHFLESAQDHPMEAFYYLAIATGMREGELLGLRWSDIDRASQSIKVQRQVQWVLKAKKGPGPRYFFKAPKSKASIRRVALGTATIEKLRLQQARVATMRGLAGAKWEELDLVFPNLYGRPIEKGNLIRQFRSLLQKAGLPKIRIHDLRHTAATLMLLMNIHPKVVSERLGHSNIQITLQLYSHAIPTMQIEAAKQIDDLLNLRSVNVTQSTDTLNLFEKAINN